MDLGTAIGAPSSSPARTSFVSPRRAGDRRSGSTAGSRAVFAALLCFLLCADAFAASPSLAPNLTPILNPEKSGAELAARLRSAAPAEPSRFEGALTLTTRDDKVTTVPIRSDILPNGSNWLVTYYAPPIPGRVSEELTIHHGLGQSNRYTVALNPTNPIPAPFPIDGTNLIRPFAGSDFWLCDLGLEFLHWSQQRVLKHEMRSSRSCWVLESVTPSPAPGGYARVVSWVDVEHDGILRAEAYDKTGKLTKEFTLGSLRKVDGRYELESMKMRNLRTGQETELKFDLPGK